MAEWQPIETAPKDGSRFLGCEQGRPGGGDDSLIAIMWWSDYWKDFVFDGERGAEPTHWQPLPEAPK